MHDVDTRPGALRETADIVHHQLLRSDHVLSYSKALKQAHYDSIETVVRKRRLLFAGAVAKKHNGRLPRRVMFGALSGGEKPKPGSPEKIWLDWVSEDFKAFEATSGSTEDSLSVFGVKTAIWTTAAKR